MANLASAVGVNVLGQIVTGVDAVPLTEDVLVPDETTVGLVKTAGEVTPVQGTPGRYAVTFTIDVINSGDNDLYNVEIYDNMTDGTINAGAWDNFEIVSITSLNGQLLTDAALVGTAPDAITSLVLSGQNLAAGAQEVIQLRVEFDANSDRGPFNNTVRFVGEDALGQEEIQEAVEPVEVPVGQSDLIVDKELIDVDILDFNQFRTTFEVRVTNNGTEDLTNVSVSDALDTTAWSAGSGFALVTAGPEAPSITQSSTPASNLTFNNSYATAGDYVLATGTMDAESSATIRFAIEFTVSDINLLPIDTGIFQTESSC